MKNKIENVYYTPDEINQYNQNKSVYIYLFSKNLKKNINKFEISNFITDNYIIDIYYIDTYIKYYDDIINKKVNLIIYYDVKTINNFTKLINVLIKYPPRYYTYIYIHGIILSEYYITNIKKKLNIYKIINIIDYTDEELVKKYNIDYKTHKKNKIYYDYIDDKKFNFIYTNLYVLDFSIYKYIPESCGANRLIQISGLCYIAASLNSIILTKKLYNLVKLNIDKNNLKNTIQKFFYNNIINNNLKNVNKNDDILLELHNDFYKDILNYKMFTPKEGGITLYYLYYILSKIFDKKCIFYKNYENINFKYFSFIRNLQSKYNKEHNIIYIEAISDINYNIKYKFIDNNKYKLVCSILHIINTDNNIGHVVVGYICNKKYYIYDSNNINIEIDWRCKKNILNINIYNGNYKFVFYINIYIKNIKNI